MDKKTLIRTLWLRMLYSRSMHGSILCVIGNAPKATLRGDRGIATVSDSSTAMEAVVFTHYFQGSQPCRTQTIDRLENLN
jgi:hypothetical protein